MNAAVLVGVACWVLGAAPAHGAPAQNHAVATDHVIASRAALEVLRNGGNAVDAAVAAAFTLSVVRPESCGVGGGGFMLIHLADNPRTPGVVDPLDTAIDFRERAPLSARPDMYVGQPENASRDTELAVATPGAIAGLLLALERYGTLDRASVIAPAIRAGETGFTPDAHYHASARLLEGADTDVRAAFLPATPDALVRNPAQSRFLASVARLGRDAMYRIAWKDIMLEIDRGPGGLGMRDFETYRAKEVPPLITSFRGRLVLSMPPPSSGGVCIHQVLGILEARPELAAPTAHDDPAYVHAVVEATRQAFADRAEWLADPEFTQVPVEGLTSGPYLAELAARIDPKRTHPAAACGSRRQQADEGERDDIGAPAGRDGAPAAVPDDHGTSHLCVVDAHGNAVACTLTINLEFGSRLLVKKHGFFMNNEMDDFTTRPGGGAAAVNAFGLTQSDRNLPGPGKRPLSSMSPTIVLDGEGNVELVAGASGGPRIITGTLQAVLNVLLFDMSAEEAVGAPRWHHQWMPDTLLMEKIDARPALAAALRERGHTVELLPADKSSAVQLIRRARGPGGEAAWQAAADQRKSAEQAGLVE